MDAPPFLQLQTGDLLSKPSDKALYFVKERGRDFYKLYSPELKCLVKE